MMVLKRRIGHGAKRSRREKKDRREESRQENNHTEDAIGIVGHILSSLWPWELQMEFA